MAVALPPAGGTLGGSISQGLGAGITEGGGTVPGLGVNIALIAPILQGLFAQIGQDQPEGRPAPAVGNSQRLFGRSPIPPESSIRSL